MFNYLRQPKLQPIILRFSRLKVKNGSQTCRGLMVQMYHRYEISVRIRSVRTICYFRMSFIKCMFVLKFNLDHLESVLLELATMTHGQVDITTSKPYFEKVFHIENHIHFKSHVHMESILWTT